MVDIDDLLGEAEVRDVGHCTQQRHRPFLELKYQPVVQLTSQQLVTHQRPALRVTHLLVVAADHRALGTHTDNGLSIKTGRIMDCQFIGCLIIEHSLYYLGTDQLRKYISKINSKCVKKNLSGSSGVEQIHKLSDLSRLK